MTEVTNLPYRDGVPFSTATPFTYREGVTNLELWHALKMWAAKVVPELNDALNAFWDQYVQDHQAVLDDIIATKDDWQALFDQFMLDVTAHIAALSDQAAADLVNSNLSKLREALDGHYTNLHHKNVRAGLSALPDNDGEASITPSNGGYSLVALGFESLLSNVRGWNNTAVGAGSMRDNIDGYNNVAVGDAALERNVGGIGDTGTSNVAPGSRNVGVGSYALRYNTTGHGNIGIGRNAAHTNVSGAYNTAVGTNAYSGQYSNGVGDEKTANDNTAIGYNAAFFTNGNNNTVVGAHALYNNLVGRSSTAIGWKSLMNATANENTAVGSDAGFGITTGQYNVAIGNRAMLSSNNGGSNTIVGVGALTFASTGSRNVGVGTSTLNMLSAGGSNVAIGYAAGSQAELINVDFTTAIGAEALAVHENSVALGAKSKTTTLNQVNVGARHIEFVNVEGVGSPVTGARIYAIMDNGKQSLAARFPNGEIKILASET